MSDPKWMSKKSIINDKKMKTENKRDAFLKAYGSVIHSSQFRRLSYKTQVFLNNHSDYARTRLTHSIEASQIGVQLARVFLKVIGINKISKLQGLKRDFEYLTAITCLSHDIGHPPFGHAGESKLSDLSEKIDFKIKFDANKQNVRLLIGDDPFRKPLNVPYCLIDSVMKYKYPSAQKTSYYLKDKDKIESILLKTGLKEIKHPTCYLMEASDDIAYICGDIEDALKHNLISEKCIKSIIKEITKESKYLKKEKKHLDKSLDSYDDNDARVIMSALMKVFVGHCIESIKYIFESSENNPDINDLPRLLNDSIKKIHHPEEKYNLLYCDLPQSNCLGKKIKKIKETIYKDHILKSVDIIESEYFAEKILEDLFNEFMSLESLPADKLYHNKLFLLLPEYVKNRIKKYLNEFGSFSERTELARIVCDYISGMTDRYAIDFWEKIKTPIRLKKVN